MPRTRSRERLVACRYASAIWLAVAAGPVAARDAGRHFDIPAEDGASALNAFAAQSGLNILFPYGVAVARQSRPIKGELPAKAALQQLLDDTGLRIVRQRNGVITLGERHRTPALPEDRSRAAAILVAPPPAAAGTMTSRDAAPPRTVAAQPPPPLVARDIIVTAQRRAERLENAPASILLLGGPELQVAGVTNLHDLAVVAPGVQISNFGIYSQPAIRGISTTFAQVAQETNVAVYVDGFYNADQLSTNQDFASIQDIQILKGPQGTLYGRNATGGAILITTRSPTDTFTADGYLSYAPRFQDRSASLFVSGPLSERIKFSIAGYYRQSDGYKKDINGFAPNIKFDDTTYSFPHHRRTLNWSRLLSGRRSGRNATPYETWSIRPKLQLELSDRLKVTLGYVHMFIDEPRTFAFMHESDRPNTAPAYNGYAHRVAHGVSIADLFTDDGAFILNYPDRPRHETRGRAALDKSFAETAKGAIRPLPMIHNHLVEVHGDNATGICSNELRMTENGKSMIGSGYYLDQMRRENGRWRFVVRDMHFIHWVPIQEGWASSGT